METKIIQEQTKNCPGIEYSQGIETLIIEGRSIPENPESIYRPLKEWITDHFETAGDLKVKIILEYINSGSSKHLLEVLKILKDYQEKGKGLSITWLYEEDDEAIMELGEHYRDTSGIPIDVEMLLE